MDKGRDPMERRSREEAAHCYEGFMRARMNAKNQMRNLMKLQSCSGGKPNCGSSEISCSENVVKEERISRSKMGTFQDPEWKKETEVLLNDSDFVAESFYANSGMIEKNGVNLGFDGVRNVVEPVGDDQLRDNAVYNISSDSGNDGEDSESEFVTESPSWTMDCENSESSDDSSSSSSSDDDFCPNKSSKKFCSNKSAANEVSISTQRKKKTVMVEDYEDESVNSESTDEEDDIDDDGSNYLSSNNLGTKEMHRLSLNWKKGKEKVLEKNENEKCTTPKKRGRPKLKIGVTNYESKNSTKMAGQHCSTQTKKRKYSEFGGTCVITLSDDEQEIQKVKIQRKRDMKKQEIIVLD